MKCFLDQPFKIDGDFFEYAKEELAGKIKSTSVSGNECRFIIQDRIRDAEEMIEIVFIRDMKMLIEMQIEVKSPESIINEYDLRGYGSDVLVRILSKCSQGQKRQYTVRNYFSYYNSMPIAGEIHISFGRKSKISSFQGFPPKTEPVTEQVLIVDTEVEAVNVNQALGVSFNHSKNIVSLLAVLLDVGFEPINSNFRMFVIKNGEKLDLRRYRTGFLDFELGLVVKDNLNGLLMPEEADDFWHGTVAVTMPTSDEGTTNVLDLSSKSELDSLFSRHRILKDSNNAANYLDGVLTEYHFPNSEILAPRLIRKFYKHVAGLSQPQKSLVLSFARLYNLAENYHRIGEVTSTVAYKVSSIEALAKTEGRSFAEFVREYSKDGSNEDLTDYFYGNVRSGHFHSGAFSFGEYQHSFNYEYDVLFQEQKENFFEFCRIIRQAIAAWLERSLSEEKPKSGDAEI